MFRGQPCKTNIGVRGCSPNVVFFSWVRCRGGLGACPRFYVRPSVPRLGAPPGVITHFWTPKNIRNSLKQTVLALLMAPLWRPYWPGCVFLTPHWWPNKGPRATVQNVVKPIWFYIFCSLESFWWPLLARPSCPKTLKSYVFFNVFETRHWATVEPLVEGQKKHHGL